MMAPELPGPHVPESGSVHMSEKPYAVLFVCLANICRSPLAEGAFRHAAEQAGLLDRFHIDSASLGRSHTGQPPDRRSILVAAQHGFDISMLRARRLKKEDFERFDLILGMDRFNFADLRALTPKGSPAEVGLYRERAEGVPASVPDPYHGTVQDFESVYQIVASGSQALLESLRPKLQAA